ncbi:MULTISPECIES: hypothetical protein [Novosphingobium]|uniref:hypothetical protein n=1 Tax=Novosphingobium TaxID=165696 RepID=UPI001CD6F100|nr:hypothetical protein [Novosphingobium percolationis]
MAQPAQSGSAPRAIEALLKADLAVADRAIASNGPILVHLLCSDDNSIFSDEIVARVRGMFNDLSRQLVVALAEAAGHADPQAWAQTIVDDLARQLMAEEALLAHLHALALEWQLTERLQGRLALDPVLPPLLQARIASSEPEVSATAMNLLAAQARFGQLQRRMQLPLAELPSDLFDGALAMLRAFAGDDPGSRDYAMSAEHSLRARRDGDRSRLALLQRVLAAIPAGEADLALSVENAGVGMFVSAIAAGSGQPRDLAIMATTERQLARLALTLAACGLRPEAIAAQFMALHPDVALPEGLALLKADAAAAILADAAHGRHAAG